MATERAAEDFSYEPFTRHTFYIEINRALVRHALAHLPPSTQERPLRIVDLACGTGMISELAIQELRHLKRSTEIIAIDSSAKGLACAAQRLAGASVTFIQSDLAEFNHAIEQADLIFFCNAIHLIPQKAALLARIFSLLSPGGLLACNTTFFDGAYAAGTEGYYRLSIRRAMEFLRREHPGVRPSRQERATAMEWLSADGYTHLLEGAGFQLLAGTLQNAAMPLQAWQDIGSYAEFIEGALPGIPLALGALALRVAAERVFHEMNLSSIPRTWLQLIARAN
jgi:ubiquinone/menaquinone biosynthesis C-methylase UbiE